MAVKSEKRRKAEALAKKAGQIQPRSQATDTVPQAEVEATLQGRVRPVEKAPTAPRVRSARSDRSRGQVGPGVQSRSGSDVPPVVKPFEDDKRAIGQEIALSLVPAPALPAFRAAQIGRGLRGIIGKRGPQTTKQEADRFRKAAEKIGTGKQRNNRKRQVNPRNEVKEQKVKKFNREEGGDRVLKTFGEASKRAKEAAKADELARLDRALRARKGVDLPGGRGKIREVSRTPEEVRTVRVEPPGEPTSFRVVKPSGGLRDTTPVRGATREARAKAKARPDQESAEQAAERLAGMRRLQAKEARELRKEQAVRTGRITPTIKREREIAVREGREPPTPGALSLRNRKALEETGLVEKAKPDELITEALDPPKRGVQTAQQQADEGLRFPDEVPDDVRKLDDELGDAFSRKQSTKGRISRAGKTDEELGAEIRRTKSIKKPGERISAKERNKRAAEAKKDDAKPNPAKLPPVRGNRVPGVDEDLNTRLLDIGEDLAGPPTPPTEGQKAAQAIGETINDAGIRGLRGGIITQKIEEKNEASRRGITVTQLRLEKRFKEEVKRLEARFGRKVAAERRDKLAKKFKQVVGNK